MAVRRCTSTIKTNEDHLYIITLASSPGSIVNLKKKKKKQGGKKKLSFKTGGCAYVFIYLEFLKNARMNRNKCFPLGEVMVRKWYALLCRSDLEPRKHFT